MKKYLISISFLIFAALIIPAFLLYAAEKTVEAPNVEVGEKWIYTDKKGDDLKEAQKARGEKITYVTEKVTDKEIILEVLMGQNSFGKTIYDRQLNLIANPDGNPHNFWKYYPNNANFSFPLYEGKKWTASYKVRTDAWEATYKVNARVAGWEQVTVPAGTFDAIKVVKKVEWQGDRIDRPDNDSDFRAADVGGASKTTFKYYEGEGELTLWYAPEVKAVVKSVWNLNEYPSSVPSSFRVMLGTSGVHIVELADYKRAEETTVASAVTPKPSGRQRPSQKAVTETPEEKETHEITPPVDSKLAFPVLAYSYSISDSNKDRILEGGEEVTIAVEVENKGKGPARDVQVVLSGDEVLLKYFDKKITVGDVKAGGKRTAKFQTILPTKITPVVAEVSIEVTEGKGYSPSETKTFKIAMKAAAVKETVDVISDINVDDVPAKTKGIEQKDNYAVVIGITNYREKEIPAVKYATKDANSIAAYLENVARIPKNNIKLMIDSSATKSDLEAYIEDWLQRRVNKNSTVYVFYAGHGTHDGQGKEAYIVPFEGHPDFPSKLYPLKRMYDSLNKLPANNVIVMLDSCFSGAEGKSVISAGARPLVISMENPVLTQGKIILLAASTGSQISSDYDKVQHGLFTYYLLKSMRGEADMNGDGIVELGELFSYVNTNVSSKASIEFNRDQTPVMLPSANIIGDRLKLPFFKIK